MKPLWIWSTYRAYKERDPLRTTIPLFLLVEVPGKMTCESCIHGCKETSPCFKYAGRFFLHAEYDVVNLFVKDIPTLNAIYFGVVSK